MRNAVLDDEAVAFLEERGRRTADEFGKELGVGPLPLLQWGHRPEYRAGTQDHEPTIFVCRTGSDWWRIRYQIAHEVFHWLCTPPVTFHWTHELFAVEMAVRAMEDLGEHEYARRVRDALSHEAERVSLDTMLTTSLADLDGDGLYGRAWLTGRQLQEGVGWERLKFLASSFDKRGRPDVVGWLLSLPKAERAKVEALLGVPSAEWV
jgi:hypothetical protein